MKKAVLLLLLLPCLAPAQEIALLNRNLKSALIVTNELAAKELTTGWFPIVAADLDSVIFVAENLVQSLNKITAPEADIQLLPVGHSQFVVLAQQAGTFINYTIILSTRFGNVGASLEVVTRGSGNRQAAQQLLRFLDYLKNNRHLAQTPPLSAALLQLLR